MQDLFRFLLAFSVVIFHYKHFAIGQALQLPASDFAPPFQNSLQYFYSSGYHAVIVFFFLSGYVLTKQTRSNRDTPFAARQFIRKRLARVYPAHLASLVIMGFFSLAVTINQSSYFITYNDNLSSFLLSVFLLNGVGLVPDNSFNLPAWSLSVEMLCYVSFAIICKTVNRQIPVFILGILLGAIIVEGSSDPNIDNVGNGFIYFFAGCITAILGKPDDSSRFSKALIAGVMSITLAVLLIFMSFDLGAGPQKLTWAVICLPLLITGIDVIDSAIDKTRPLKILGLLSFSIYIWHFPVQALMYYTCETNYISCSQNWYNSGITLAIYLALTLFASFVSLHTIERFGRKIFI